jgi:hypothetical protein
MFTVTVVLNSVYGQHASNQLTLTDAPNREKILRASIALPESEANLFWPLYEQYETRLNAMKENTIESLRQLILDHGEGSLEKVQKLLTDQRTEAALKKEYFDKILISTNGAVALQFLQGDALYDLLLKSKMYEQMQPSETVWSPAIMTNESLKRNILEFALGVNANDTTRFRSLLENFEFDFSRVVGHGYVFFEYYIDDASGWTPGQCKKLGDSFIHMQLNEVKVKDQYLRKFDEAFGPDFAARFMSLQEYFCMMSKLKVWSDYVSIPD